MKTHAKYSAICIAALAAALTAPATAHEQVPPAAPAQAAMPDLAVPPETGTEVRVLTSTGGRHGQSIRWAAPDGTRWARESMLLRGFVTEIDQQTRFNPDGSIREIVIRGRTPQGDASETFRVENGRFTYSSPVDRGEGEYRPGLTYATYGGLMEPGILLVEALLRAPGRRLSLAPSGEASLNPLTELEVTNARGETKRLTAVTIDGLGLAPQPVWLEGDRVFGAAGFINVLPAGWEDVAPRLSAAQEAALAERAPELLARVAPRHEGPVAFTNVRLYDADARTFREGMTVVAEGGRITAVGPAAAITLPAGARTYDGAGRTLVPGLWDAHQHYGGDATGPLLLSLGITSVRDPGNRPEESIARKRRIDEGRLLGPRVIPVMLIDGPGPLAAQMAVTATDEASAIAAVRQAQNMGFAGVKLYGSLDPALVPVISAEAKRLGLRVQGHVPRTMRPLDAVRAGYDELTHINFVMMQAMPDEVVNQSNGLQRFYGPGRYAAGVDLNSPEMRAYIEELARRGTTVDATLAIFEGGFTEDPGQLAASYRPFDGKLPPILSRGFRSGGFAPTPEVSRDQMRQSFARLQELVVALHRAGVPVVAGTDGSGLELVRDLELYVEGGMSPADALATATIVPSTQFGVADDRGSIAVGKLSDLVLVDGDPSRNIGDLRKVHTVMLGDRLMDGDALRSAAGLSGRPD
ncbi:MAG: amidohydrolase family protein [Allosphingosinicella sp.]|uniref:amidohydrolase family protein n=1 Tax=Allosphingosinicella sp. TaxID=2823234 RepID=UPI003956C36D